MRQSQMKRDQGMILPNPNTTLSWYKCFLLLCAIWMLFTYCLMSLEYSTCPDDALPILMLAYYSN